MYDITAGYDTSVNLATDDGMLDYLTWYGMQFLIRQSNLFVGDNLRLMLSKTTVEKYSKFLSDPGNLTIVCARAKRSNINLCNYPIWAAFLDDCYKTSIAPGDNKVRDVVYEAFSTEDHFINYYLDWKSDVDWMDIYNLYYSKQKRSSYVSRPFAKCLEKYFAQNPLCARISIEADLFDAEHKPDASVRTEMYKAYISAGLLTKKKARKIRSESSEYTSMSAVAFLMKAAEDNPLLYPNIDELLLQFSDTKHASVQEAIAKGAPFKILYAFVGFDDLHSKRTIEQRMQNGK